MSAPSPAGSVKLALALLAGATLAGCVTGPATPVEKSMVDTAIAENSALPASREERDLADRKDLLSQAAFWGKEYEKNPNEYEASVKLARTLRALGSSQKAMEVATQALVRKPGDVDLTLIYAQAALNNGEPESAATMLARAEQAGSGDWRMMSVIGVVMDQLGKHPEARLYYEKALTLSPGNPRVLSNLGLSLALDNQPAKAEEVLRQAAQAAGTDTRVTQNLALVLGVQGKFEEAAAVERPDMPDVVISANQDYYRSLLSPSRNWDKLRGQQN